MTLLLIGQAGAATLDSGPDFEASWTNSIRTSTSYQVNEVPPLAAGSCGLAPNCGFGDGFTQGRVDFLSELELQGRDSGLHASLEARRDVVEPNEGYFDLFEAYGHVTVPIGGDRPLSVFLGRHTVIWGESLFFSGNSIAGAMAPIDNTVRDASRYQSNARFLPVGQASFSWQVSGSLALLGYDQFEWRRNRVDPEDAYAGIGDVLGAEFNRQIVLALPYYGKVSYDRETAPTPSSRDQFGLGAKFHKDAFELGLFGLSFDAKTPTILYDGEDARYTLDYGRGIDLIGISLAGPLADASFAAEFSGRRNMPLVTGGTFLEPPFYARSGPRGDTLHGQMSVTAEIAPLPILPGGADWAFEVAGNHLVTTTFEPDQLVAGRTRSAAALRTVFTPQFFQILPRLDLTLPISLGYNFLGLSQVLPDMNRGTGDVGIGVTATLGQSWTGSLSLTRYFGTSKTPFGAVAYGGNPLSQWDSLSLSLQRSF
jgi:hypothetical protein